MFCYKGNPCEKKTFVLNRYHLIFPKFGQKGVSIISVLSPWHEKNNCSKKNYIILFGYTDKLRSQFLTVFPYSWFSMLVHYCRFLGLIEFTPNRISKQYVWSKFRLSKILFCTVIMSFMTVAHIEAPKHYVKFLLKIWNLNFFENLKKDFQDKNFWTERIVLIVMLDG